MGSKIIVHNVVEIVYLQLIALSNHIFTDFNFNQIRVLYLQIRNQQLAALLDQHTKANATLTKQLEELVYTHIFLFEIEMILVLVWLSSNFDITVY